MDNADLHGNRAIPAEALRTGLPSRIKSAYLGVDRMVS